MLSMPFAFYLYFPSSLPPGSRGLKGASLLSVDSIACLAEKKEEAELLSKRGKKSK